ncbi:MAG: hypothetical protein JRD89_13590 [Deltaproteobacteria bacterium]|nr:hypothetical protein [Deltaproteobacteria bacterium]
MRSVMIPGKGVVGFVEAEKPDEVKRIGVYDVKYLRKLWNILWQLHEFGTTEVELAYFRSETGLNVLLARPAEGADEGWFALAPIDPSRG